MFKNKQGTFLTQQVRPTPALSGSSVTYWKIAMIGGGLAVSPALLEAPNKANTITL